VLYRAIANQLQDRINAGEWPPGKRMPTESALAAEFGVNRLTIRQALAQLRQIGAIDIRQGSGTYVSVPRPPILEISIDAADQAVDTGSVHASIKSISHNVTESPLGYEADPNPRAAGHLGLDAGYLGRLDIVCDSDGVPFSVSSYWLDDRRFSGLVAAWIPEATLATVMREVYGITLYYDWRGFTAAAAGTVEVAHLGGPLGAPLIVRDGVSVDPDGTPVYYVRRRIRAERASYVLRYRR
jgi:DNA-binding GntR family transcriptional regulator